MNSNNISFSHFWYIVCESKELKDDQLIQRKILDEWIVLFRDENGTPCAFQDRCIHRNSLLSKGWVKDGKLQCSYHGWTFRGDGKVSAIPSEGASAKMGSRCAKVYQVQEQQDLIYVRLEENVSFTTKPFTMPHYKEKGFETVRLFNVFKNSVLNCVENYIDVPHTVFVHDKIFREALKEEITTKIIRSNGSVSIEYFGETSNLGWFSWFLNPKKVPIIHIDTYTMPNVSCVKYIIDKKEFWITSQSIPVTSDETWVWTDLTYNFGHPFLNKLAKPIVRYQGQSVINQDIEVLNIQAQVIKKYGENFSNASADIIHVMIESIYNAIKDGRNPLDLPEYKKEVKFWV